MAADPLAEAYDRHAGPLYRFLCGFLGNRDDAADVIQTVFAKLASRGLTGIANLEQYLWTSARNEARRLGSRRRGPYLEPRNGKPPDPTAQEAVESVLASLPDEQREVVVLHAFEGLTFREVGERLGISGDTAASRFRYARDKLREIL